MLEWTYPVTASPARRGDAVIDDPAYQRQLSLARALRGDLQASDREQTRRRVVAQREVKAALSAWVSATLDAQRLYARVWASPPSGEWVPSEQDMEYAEGRIARARRWYDAAAEAALSRRPEPRHVRSALATRAWVRDSYVRAGLMPRTADLVLAEDPSACLSDPWDGTGTIAVTVLAPRYVAAPDGTLATVQGPWRGPVHLLPAEAPPIGSADPPSVPRKARIMAATLTLAGPRARPDLRLTLRAKAPRSFASRHALAPPLFTGSKHV